MALSITTGWSPQNLNGLLAWYKADASVYTDAGTTLATNGQTVQQWNDQSGNGNHLSQSTVASQPAFNTAGLNNKQALVFTSGATDDWMRKTSFNFGSASPSFSVFVVLRYSVSDNNGCLISIYNSIDDYSQPSSIRALGVMADSIGLLNTAWNNNIYDLTSTNSDSTPYRAGITFNGTTLTGYTNKVAGTPQTAAVALSQSQQLTVGADRTGTQGMSCAISEIVITKTALNAAELAYLDGYFQAKWGLDRWTPAQLPGLVAWYDAKTGVYSDAGTTLAVGGQTVQQWNDQSGNGRHLSQATAGNRPVFTTTGLNSRQTIIFTAASATGLFSGATAIDISATTLSAFLVGKVRSASASDARILSLQSGASADSDSALRFTLYRPGAGAAFAAYRNLNGPLSQTSLTYDTAMRFGLIFDSVNVTTYKDNVAGTPSATTGTFLSAGRLGVGEYTIVSQPLDGDISELVMTNTALSSTQRTQLDDYFKVKWGL